MLTIYVFMFPSSLVTTISNLLVPVFISFVPAPVTVANSLSGVAFICTKFKSPDAIILYSFVYLLNFGLIVKLVFKLLTTKFCK